MLRKFWGNCEEDGIIITVKVTTLVFFTVYEKKNVVLFNELEKTIRKLGGRSLP